MSEATVGIDVGASKVVAAAVDHNGSILRRIECEPTSESHSAGLVDQLTRLIAALGVDGRPPRAVGVGTAGLVHWPAGDLGFAANHTHRDLKLGRNLAASCGLPVVVENDANAAAFAESWTGRHGEKAMLFLSVGTGIGSGFVVNGELVRGRGGVGAELGHIVVDRKSAERCSCGFRGCLETVASGVALAREGRRIVKTDRHSLLAKRVRSSDDVTPAVMIDAALDGDPEVVRLVDAMGRVLGRTIAENVMSLLPVDVVVVGGGLANLDRVLLDPMRSACDRALGRHKYLRAPRIMTARHGDDAILVGAALLADQHQLTAARTAAIVPGDQAPCDRRLAATLPAPSH